MAASRIIHFLDPNSFFQCVFLSSLAPFLYTLFTVDALSVGKIGPKRQSETKRGICPFGDGGASREAARQFSPQLGIQHSNCMRRRKSANKRSWSARQREQRQRQRQRRGPGMGLLSTSHDSTVPPA
ncbi:hypothetical protein K402DRAFT_402740 [Aulographum hederae CBS 113979]|uniref:Uncharacterized protein n=1 Tax=Aulographum hederae CBS 113979 TaxID=1176131 RepID=A0A6G1H6A6_9PEZI|nr:hypothetical protein K402DRAFT_402740 [Aulographum hederae CBS 113979]